MSDTDNMYRLTQEQLSEILELHGKWLRGEHGGVRAYFREAILENANLQGANLQGANLREANLREANLREANLQGANLREANLREANLVGANLREANLVGAYLRRAKLQGANLVGAYLRRAKLQGANLRGAILREANLREANLEGADIKYALLTGANLEGAKLPSPVLDLSACTVGYKKVLNMDRTERVVIELRFPAGAELVSTVIGRKCRASEAVVVRCVSTGHENETEFQSMHDRNFVYRVGETVKPEAPLDSRITVECTSGIHFFTTKLEAEEY